MRSDNTIKVIIRRGLHRARALRGIINRKSVFLNTKCSRVNELYVLTLVKIYTTGTVQIHSYRVLNANHLAQIVSKMCK